MTFHRACLRIRQATFACESEAREIDDIVRDWACYTEQEMRRGVYRVLRGQAASGDAAK